MHARGYTTCPGTSAAIGFLYIRGRKMNSVYRKSIFEKDGKFKFLLFEQRGESLYPSLCDSVESPSIFDMSCAIIQVAHFGVPKGATEHDYMSQRDRLERDGWAFRVEAFDELPIGVGH